MNTEGNLSNKFSVKKQVAKTKYRFRLKIGKVNGLRIHSKYCNKNMRGK